MYLYQTTVYNLGIYYVYACKHEILQQRLKIQTTVTFDNCLIPNTHTATISAIMKPIYCCLNGSQLTFIDMHDDPNMFFQNLRKQLDIVL